MNTTGQRLAFLRSEFISIDRRLSELENENSAMRQAQQRLGARLLKIFCVITEPFPKIKNLLARCADVLLRSLEFSLESRRRLRRTWRNLRAEKVNNEPWPLDKPLVTVVVPCFNYGHFLPETVASILQQTWQDFEIILVDGGSTDGVTRDVVRQQASVSPKIRCIFQPSRSTVGEDRKTGIEQARGKYVMFLDADDIIDSTYLEKAATLLEVEGIDVVTPWVKVFTRREAHNFINEGKQDDWNTGGLILPQILHANYCSTVAMFRRSFWVGNQIGYATAREHFEDWDFWIRFAVAGARYRIIPEYLHYYRMHGNSWSDAAGGDHTPHMQNVRNRFRQYHENPSALGAALKRQQQLVDVKDGLLNIAQRKWQKSDSTQESTKVHVMVAVPWFDRGGSSILLCDAFRRLQGDTRFSFVSTVPDEQYYLTQGVDLYTGVTDNVFPIGFLSPPKRREYMLGLLEKTRPDILMIVGSRFTYELLPEIRARFPGIKVVDHLYNIEGHVHSNREFAKFIDFHIVANREVFNLLLKKGEAASRIEVVPHGIDLRFFDIEKLQSRGDSKSRVLGQIGRLSEEKRPQDFVAALKKFPDIRGIFCGTGPLRGRMLLKTVEEVLSGRIEFCAPENALDFYSRIDALVITSRVEGLPLVLLEAMALGIPCVAASVGGIPDVITDGENGFLYKSGNVEELEKQLRRFFEMDESGRKAMGEKARKTVLSGYSIETCSEHYRKVFHSVKGAR